MTADVEQPQPGRARQEARLLGLDDLPFLAAVRVGAIVAIVLGLSRADATRADTEPAKVGSADVAEKGHGDMAPQPTWYRDPDLPPEVPPLSARSRPDGARNGLFFEFGGLGILYSVNYERHVSLPGSPCTDLALRVGFGALPGYVSIPVTGTVLRWSGHHALEVGLGGVWSGMLDLGLAGAGILGYRYGSRDGGPMVRLAYMPLLGSGVARNGIGHWAGLAIGGMF